jgi:hypothetical protein
LGEKLARWLGADDATIRSDSTTMGMRWSDARPGFNCASLTIPMRCVQLNLDFTEVPPGSYRLSLTARRGTREAMASRLFTLGIKPNG